MSRIPKILLVDDEHINVEFFDVMLSRLGYDVITAGDGDTALEKITEERPDLVLLDNILPGKTGWEITRQIKQDPEYADISIIMFSAMDDVEDKVDGFELGIEDYITKPFNFSEVLARIRAVLRQRELSHQVVRRERRLALSETLTNTLISFTRRIKEPIQELRDMAASLDMSDGDAVKRLVERTTRETTETLATIEGLEEEVEELQSQDDELKAKELSLEDLESKFRKHTTTSLYGVKEKHDDQ